MRMITDYFFSFFNSILEFISSIFSQKKITFPDSRITVTIITTKHANIGEGAFSTVFKVKDSNTGKHYALKRMLLQSSEIYGMAANEVHAFRRFQHRNLLKLLDVVEISDERSLLMTTNSAFSASSSVYSNGGYSKPNRSNANSSSKSAVYLLLPYCSRGSLRQSLTNVLEGKETKPSLRSVFTQFKKICEALNVLHNFNPSYVHQDIKPDNILIDHRGEPILTDFGSVSEAVIAVNNRNDILRVQDEAAQYCTAPYRAPELYEPSKGMVLDCRTDVWAMGCLLFAWWYGYSPFECEFTYDGRVRVTESSALRVLAKIPQKPQSNIDDQHLSTIVEWILEKDIHKRPYISDIITRLNEMVSREAANDSYAIGDFSFEKGEQHENNFV